MKLVIAGPPRLSINLSLKEAGISHPFGDTVGYKMAVMVEKRFGREALIGIVLDPRRLLLLYNRVASEQNAHSKEPLPLWSEEILKEVQAGPRSN